MPTQVEATYEADEDVLRLDRKLDIRNHSRVKVTVESVEEGVSLARQLGGRIVINEDAARYIIDHVDIFESEESE